MNLYALAENLGMTVARMKREMPIAEYIGWLRFYAARAEAQTRAAGPPVIETSEDMARFWGAKPNG